MRDVLQSLARALRAIVGAPDYDRYLAHMRAHHAGCTPLSETEFVERRLAERYTRPGSRCC